MLPPRIALVDDDPSIRRGVGRLLELSGFLVSTYASAEDLLRAGALDTFECLVLDVHLPGLSGPEAYAGMLQRGGTPPAVFITAHDASDTQELLLRATTTPCVRKPFRRQQLLAAIDAARGRAGASSG